MIEINKITNIQDNLLPSFFNARQNTNWKALVEAIGQNDDNVALLIQQVKNEIFAKTADGIYLDRVGNNTGVIRPKDVGMQDDDYREYIPIMSYMPKQIKKTINELIKIYFSEECTNAYIDSTMPSPYNLDDGYTLKYKLDNQNEELIEFKTDDFVNIHAATADEIVSIINRTSRYAFANTIYDNINRVEYVRIYTKTTGREGFIELTGGTSDIFLKFEGFNTYSGNGNDTQWFIDKVGNLMQFKYIGGTNPRIDKLEEGDIVLSLISNNDGSFIVESIDLSDQSIYFRNNFGYAPAGGYFYTQSSSDELKFAKPYRSNVYKRLSRALLWEISPNEFKIEIPSMPSIVKRELQGATHMNGLIARVTSVVSSTELTIDDITGWETSGTIDIEFIKKYPNQYINNSGVLSTDPLDIRTKSIYKKTKYGYNGIVGNTLQNITPALPSLYTEDDYTISAISRAGNITTVIFTTPHTIPNNSYILVTGVPGGGNFNGTFLVTSVGVNSVTYLNYGINAVAASGTVLYENVGIADSGHIVYQLSLPDSTESFLGAYIYDPRHPYMVRGESDTLNNIIKAGDKKVFISILGTGNLPNSEGYLIVDHGLSTEEGPVKYTTISNTTVFIDSTYQFKYTHGVGSVLNLCDNNMQVVGNTSYAAYITDPSVAIARFKEAVLEIKAAGIGVDWIINYPNLYYAGYDIFNI